MLKLEVTPEEMNLLVNALAQRPFAEVNALLAKLIAQANVSAQAPPED